MNASCFATGVNSYMLENETSLASSIATSFFISAAVGVLFAPVFLMIYQAFVKMLMMINDPQANDFEVTQRATPNPYYPDITTHLLLKRCSNDNIIFSGFLLALFCSFPFSWRFAYTLL